MRVIWYSTINDCTNGRNSATGTCSTRGTEPQIHEGKGVSTAGTNTEILRARKYPQQYRTPKNCFVPLVESGICLLVDVATLPTIYDVWHPLLLPPGYPTQDLSPARRLSDLILLPPRLPQERKDKKNTLQFFRLFRYAYPSSSFRCNRKRPSLLSLACASGRLSFAVGERYYFVCNSFLQSLSTYVRTPTPHSILRFRPAPQTPDLRTSNRPLLIVRAAFAVHKLRAHEMPQVFFLENT